MYAQTIAYGLLSARISRQSGGLTTDDAALMAPPTSPFLKEMLGTFLEAGGRKSAGGGNRLDFDELGVSAVVDLLRAADMEAVLDDFDKTNPDEDPVIHFYELFLKQYDPKKRMQRGVFYTPRPVVGFIVRSVDEVLRTEFGLEDGLASTATWADVIAAKPEIKLPAGAKLTDAFVRILDPATGTGTFLVECIDLIYKTMVKKWKAAGKRDVEIKALWNAYVPAHLLPRLTGFELMMAPYAIAHVKVGLKLVDTGYLFPAGGDARAQIFLTNALEPAQDLDMQLAFMNEALAHEAKAANEAKETRFTVVVGNPPYAGHSSNPSRDAKGRLTHVGEMIRPFFFVDGQPLGEQNPKWLNNDYVKFIRLAQLTIDSAGSGVLGFITSHSWLDSPTFRGMRASLIDSFTKLWIIDGHGNIKKNETTPDGSPDQGLFEIEEGTNITLAAAISGSREIRHTDLFGKIIEKIDWLNKSALVSITNDLSPRAPLRLLTMHQARGVDEYEKFSSLTFVLGTFSLGSLTKRDNLAVDISPKALEDKIAGFIDASVSDEAIAERFDLPLRDNDRWDLSKARKAFSAKELSRYTTRVEWRPFDHRYMVSHPSYVARLNDRVLKNVGDGRIAFVTVRQLANLPFDHIFVAADRTDQHYISVRTKEGGVVFPLWLTAQGTETRTLPNIAPAFANRVAALTGLAYDDCVEGPKQGALAGVIAPKPEQTAMFATRRERGDPGHSFGPRDLFDWIYAVLHSPAYRSRYADYLKSDFARVPLPGSAALFEALVPLGTRLVALHLLDAPAAPDLADPKPIRFVGNVEPRVAAKPEFKAGRVHINAGCWFEDVPERAWNFHIGGYQPAQKWLKDRAAKGGKKASDGRVLTPDDLLHYRRMITAMDATIDIMAQIDTIIDQHGGWPTAFKGMTDDGD